ncbi:MAG TPA: DUF2125 domain-containing protein [Rhizomicrobium sp.]|jgi:hypothetical protein
MRFSHRAFLYGPFALLVILALSVMVYWWFAARAVDGFLAESNGQAVAPGVTLKFAGKHIQGFPFRIDAMLDDVELDVQTSQGPASWHSQHFVMHALTYGPSQAIYEAAGVQTLRWTGLDGQKHVWSFTPGLLRASSFTQATGPTAGLARFDLDVIAIRSPELNADRFQFHIRRNPTHDGFDIAVSGQNIHLAPLLQSGFGDTISVLSVDASAAPATPLASLFAGKGDWRASLENWRTHNGALKLNALQVNWNTLKANASGQLSLDAQHRPTGTVDVNLDGVQSLAGGLAKIGLPEGSDNGLAPALMAMAQASNAQIQMSAGIGFKDGVISVGAMPAGVARPLY